MSAGIVHSTETLIQSKWLLGCTEMTDSVKRCPMLFTLRKAGSAHEMWHGSLVMQKVTNNAKHFHLQEQVKSKTKTK